MVYLDKFYTDSDEAKRLINYVGIEKYDVIIEPSAGNGAFSNHIRGVLAYDIEPDSPTITKQDFLDVSSIPDGLTLFIGNPPFGNRAILAKQFIKKAISLGADTIAFILPSTFSKYTNQKIFSDEWSLVIEEGLYNNNFKLPNGDMYYVPCKFYVWTKLDSGVNLRKVKQPQPAEFKFLKRGSEDAHFTLTGTHGTTKDLNEVTNSKAEHYIYVNDGYSVSAVRDKLDRLNYSKNSSVSGGNYWLSQQDILEAWYNYDQVVKFINNK